MADQKTDKPADKPASTSAQSSKPPAGEASDPEVHRLMAELETARLNGNDDDAKRLTAEIGKLGYAA